MTNTATLSTKIIARKAQSLSADNKFSGVIDLYEKFFEELKNLRDERETVYEKIKSHGRPVIVFGSGQMAALVTKELESFGINVDGYCVDEKYFKPDTPLRVYNFAELVTQPDKYVFVLGMNSDYVDSDRSLEFLRDKRIISYMTYPYAFRFISKDFILSRKDEFAETFSLLDDDLSRRTLSAYLRLMFTFDQSALFDVFERGMYFNSLTESAKGGIFVDCGAYRGDTAERFINWSGGRYERIFAIQADKKNFSMLEGFVRDKGYKNVSLINCGVWNKKGVLSFNSTGSVLSYLVDADTNYEMDAEFDSIQVDTLDNIIGDEPVNFVKLMIQGSELNALQGAVNVVKSQKPLLAIAAFQNPSALITIPQFIKNLNVGYKIYLRKHSRFSTAEFILYAVPED